MSMSLHMQVSHSEPDWRWRGIIGLVAAADRIGPEFRGELKRRAPVGKAPNDPHPGRMRESIRYSRTTSATTVRMEFKAHTPYARYVVGGTGPHLIAPRAARALHWIGPHGDVFAQLVHHPGTRPNLFAHEALLTARAGILEAFRDQIGGAR